jgi:uncharacterized repeat protein (TIGR02543 family)
MKKLLTAALIALFALGAATLTSCKDPEEPQPPQSYTISVTNDGNGTASADKTTATAGATVTLTATPKEGYTFSKWTVESGGATLSPNAATSPATFRMPEANVSLKAEFAPVVTQAPIEVPDEEDLSQTAFADENSTGEITFTARAPWTIDVDAVAATRASNVPWVRLYLNGVETYSGPAGEFTLEVVVDGNYTGETRKATITLESDGEEIDIALEQQGKKEDGTVPDVKGPLTAHPWIHISTTESDSPGYENKDLYTLTFNEDGTVVNDDPENGWTTSYTVSGNVLTVGEGDETTVCTIVTLTDEEFIFTEEYEGSVATHKFSKNAPPPSENAVMIAAHPWKQVSFHSTQDGEGYDDDDDMDATITFNADGTITATGADQDYFTDYFGLNPLPTWSVSGDTLILHVASSGAMIPLPDAGLEITTLTDEALEVTGSFDVEEDGEPTSYTVTMTFVK